jgi:hypothetical protein
MIRDKLEITNAEALRQGTISECQEKDCHRIFTSLQAVRNYFSKTHAAGTLENWEPQMRCVHQQWKSEMGEISESEHMERCKVMEAKQMSKLRMNRYQSSITSCS